MLLAAILFLLQAKEVWALFLFAVLSGLGLGGISSSQSPLSARYFGLKSHGSIFGAIAGITVIVSAMSPFITGYLFDIMGHYQVSFIVWACLSLTGLIICILLRPPEKQINIRAN
jgi:MFS family permease